MHDGDGPGRRQHTETSSFKSRFDSFVRGLDISTSTKELVLSLGGEEAKELAPMFFKNSLKIIGRAAGLYSIASVGAEYIENPTTANLLKLTVTTGVVIFGLASSGGVATDFFLFGMSIFNDTQWSTDMYNYLGNQIDRIAGYSVGGAVYSATSGFLRDVNSQLTH